MIRSPLGLRLDVSRPVKDQIRGAASAGARGVVLDAAGDLAPERLSETGRRDVRHALRSVEQSLIAVSLPTRRPFDTLDQIEDRLARADLAFALAYDLGTRLVLARVGGLPPEDDAPRRRCSPRHSRSSAGGPTIEGSGSRSRRGPSPAACSARSWTPSGCRPWP